ncbi:protein-L-isoaspartate O-methyltransferase family protein [Teichococcus oryzae]|uniref:Protein-L-isoaspartate O-methyltransferase n=1 Tax=Teichococcus oryzae TaxID=1608942 RepID=A0A5B2TBM5_9PROT|nr:protein-L-isoaspartate O-methyltransferase [Pseudoroseomonas oryzae]KAA2211464.1 protein-L-isoaspartate O-methyltransferase [Pseudoroseomonas oryzae]
MDFGAARKWMVDGQLRPNKVTDPRIISAMLDLPRHRFVPADMVPRAYADEDVPLGEGRVLLQPMMLARLLQLAEIRSGDSVLLIGAGTGYGAALLARMGGRVTALEESATLVTVGREVMGEVALAPGHVQFVEGPLAAGHAATAPYDLIVIQGEVSAIPPALTEQLTEGGRLVAIRRPPGQMGVAVIGRRVGGVFSVVPAFDCATAALPGFAQKATFAL